MAFSLSLTSSSHWLKLLPIQNPRRRRFVKCSADIESNVVINGVDTVKLNGKGNNNSIDAILSRNSNGNGKGNGSLAKYVNGNGNANGRVNGGVVMEEVASVKTRTKTNGKTNGKIGQEDAWFKQGGRDRLEVSVAPGGRWSRFKTYSTIQRTPLSLECG